MCRKMMYAIVFSSKSQTILKENGASTLKHEARIIHRRCHETREYYSPSKSRGLTNGASKEAEFLSHVTNTYFDPKINQNFVQQGSTGKILSVLFPSGNSNPSSLR